MSRGTPWSTHSLDPAKSPATLSRCFDLSYEMHELKNCVCSTARHTLPPRKSTKNLSLKCIVLFVRVYVQSLIKIEYRYSVGRYNTCGSVFDTS